ncbi:FAD linked oxidases, C-terminal domain [Marinobacter sp. es.048]|nr:FAD linked oxidases, C-terminal domain [Marinobacter sp. es.048]
MRLQHRPSWRATASGRFDSFMKGVDAVRQTVQPGLFPSNCCLLDEAEVIINRIADGPCVILVLGFESADHPQDQKIERAAAIAEEHGGVLQKDGITYNPDHSEKESSEAESWRNAFIPMPYWRNRLTATGMIADTFETAITWDKFPDLYRAVKSTKETALREITQRPFSFSCRFTHVYPDGPAPYFTFYCVGDTTGDLGKALEKGNSSSASPWKYWPSKALPSHIITRLAGIIVWVMSSRHHRCFVRSRRRASTSWIPRGSRIRALSSTRETKTLVLRVCYQIRATLSVLMHTVESSPQPGSPERLRRHSGQESEKRVGPEGNQCCDSDHRPAGWFRGPETPG